MPKLSLDPAPLIDGSDPAQLQELRDSIQRNYNKIQDHINILQKTVDDLKALHP